MPLTSLCCILLSLALAACSLTLTSVPKTVEAGKIPVCTTSSVRPIVDGGSTAIFAGLGLVMFGDDDDHTHSGDEDSDHMHLGSAGLGILFSGVAIAYLASTIYGSMQVSRCREAKDPNLVAKAKDAVAAEVPVDLIELQALEERRAESVGQFDRPGRARGIQECIASWEKREAAASPRAQSKAYLAMSETCRALYWQKKECSSLDARVRATDDPAQKRMLLVKAPLSCSDFLPQP